MNLHAIRAIAQKDFLIEYRAKEALNAILFFSLLVLAIASFAMEPGSDAARELGGGILWISYFFSGIISLNRSFAIERDENAIQSLLLVPLPKLYIYWGKFVTNILYFLSIEVVICGAFIILFNVPISWNLAILWIYIVLVDIGFVSIGTLFASMLLKTKTREMMLPILLFPVSIPLVIAAVKASTLLLQQMPHAMCIPWLKIIIAFDIMYVTASYLLAEYTIGE
jgi:heme exporter protein B